MRKLPKSWENLRYSILIVQNKLGKKVEKFNTVKKSLIFLAIFNIINVRCTNKLAMKND